MYKGDESQHEQQFEEYLDGSLLDAGREALRNRLAGEKDLRAEAEMQERINRALRKLFPVVQPPDDSVLEKVVVRDESGTSMSRRHRLRHASAIGVAAALVGILALWFVQNAEQPAPFFQPTPLAQIFRETIRNGFEPYYECRDNARFAATFAQRQGKPLTLLPMPEGVQMLGLSYPGGLSRDTTAMLATVDDEPVMVFVDRQTVADHLNPEVVAGSETTNVFRQQRDGFVFYEVSGLDQPRVMKYLAPAASASVPQ